MATAKINSTLTQLSIAEETSIGVLPGSPVWQDLEPNDYNDFGSQLSTVAREPIEQSRQRKKGTVTDLDASGGFSTDFTKSNMTKYMQGAFFADARELTTTKPLNGASITITGADNADSSYNAAAGLNAFSAGDLVVVSGFVSGANNGLKLVSAATATKLTVGGTLTTETGTAAVTIAKSGVQFASGDAQITKDGDLYALELTAGTFAGQQGLLPGSWVYIGGDATISQFSTHVGYARVRTVAAKKLTFDMMPTPLSAADAGTGKTIQMFLGVVIRNEKDPVLIKQRSYNVERTLGTSDIGVQAEYLDGALFNEVTINIPTADKVTMDIGLVATNYSTRSGAVGDEKKSGTHIPAPGQEAYNTSQNIPNVGIVAYNPAVSTQKPLFVYSENVTASINNNITPDKAVGVLGAFDVSTGRFEVDWSMDAYFVDVAALASIRNNDDIGAYAIVAAKNAGTIFDAPLGTLNGGQLTVETGSAIKTALEFAAAENQHGYTMQMQAFSYLPTVAM